MQLEYDLTEEDYLQFNRHQLLHMPKVRRVSSVIYVMPGIVMLMIILALPRHESIKQLLVLMIGALWTFLAPRYFRSSSRRRLQQMIREQDNTNLFGKYMLTIMPEGLVSVKESSRSEVKWKGISKVAAGEQGVYLYNSGASAYLVPNSAFDAVNTRERFLEEVLRYREQAAGLIETV